jgi:hypothetical protein
MRATIDLLSASGKKVIVMKQTPEIDLNPVSCLVSRPLALHTAKARCDVPVDRVRSYLAEYEPVFDATVRPRPGLVVVDPVPVLCAGDSCRVMDGVLPVYRDDLHLSLHGSEYMASRIAAFGP